MVYTVLNGLHERVTYVGLLGGSEKIRKDLGPDEELVHHKPVDEHRIERPGKMLKTLKVLEP